ESRGFGCLVASVEQPLHADADSKERSSRRDGAVDGLAPGSIQPGGGAEVSDTRHDHAARLPALLGHRRHDEVGAERRQRLADRGQIASAVINECNHSSPFVLGSIFASRLSFAHATRSARANALNTASMWWWLERPYNTLACTLARAPMAKPSKKSWTNSVCRSPTIRTFTLRSTTACGRLLRSTATTASVSSIGMTK